LFETKEHLYEISHNSINTSFEIVTKEILDVSIAIQRLYQGALDFERSSFGIFPPEDFKIVHQLQVGWSQPIQDAIVQLFDFLQQI